MKRYTLLLVLMLLVSCQTKTKKEVAGKTNKKETPKILEKQNYSISKYSSRGYRDIISDLYHEAVKNNQKLKDLDKNINDITKLKNDRLDTWYKYSNNNTNYWATAHRYINDIKDSILRKESLEIITKLESKYKKSVSAYDFEMADITKKTISLNDQYILLKLAVTLPMINNYQKNEKPNITPLKNIRKKYDSLILETKKFSRFKK